MNINKFLKEEVKKIKPYNPNIFMAKYKLDTNESPYDVPIKIKQKILNKIKNISLNRYPDPYSINLKISLSKKLNIKKENIMIGNGSDEIIYYLLQSFINKGDKIITLFPSFEIYKILGLINGAKVKEIMLNKNFDIDDNKIINLTKLSKPKFIFIAYPNNPTGNCFSENKILNILKNVDCFVVIDEAYFEFSKKTFLKYQKKYKNLIILRTFSKAYSLAGLRVGYMIADKNIIHIVSKVKLPYNVNSVSQIFAKEILEYKNIFEKNIKQIITERDKLYHAIKKKYKVIKSDANFLFVNLEKESSVRKIKNKCRKEKVSIRFFNYDFLKNFVRITIGKPEENKVVKKILNV